MVPVKCSIAIIIALHFVLFRDAKFKKCDAFIGFQKDTPASVIFQATNQLKTFHEVAKERLVDVDNQEEPVNDSGVSRLCT